MRRGWMQPGDKSTLKLLLITFLWLLSVKTVHHYQLWTCSWLKPRAFSFFNEPSAWYLHEEWAQTLVLPLPVLGHWAGKKSLWWRGRGRGGAQVSRCYDLFRGFKPTTPQTTSVKDQRNQSDVWFTAKQLMCVRSQTSSSRPHHWSSAGTHFQSVDSDW